ncbi:ATP synthase F1 subunit epsilon [Synechococcus sp. PCC 7336]|uniref:ATP synthase F1 subunit epsilon n=1 Tax=Synechococcus sp. PCC 7336 TaxID=195250 RepID=UPI00036D7DC1|nr:ATP synthase F1 subunit epsilon [Synechococcus sp. PCC 7336]
MTLSVQVIGPDSTVWDAPADEVILPATSGQLGILTNHAPLLTALGSGVMRLRSQGQWTAIAVMGGLAEIEDNTVSVLVKRAVSGGDVDTAAAQAALEEANATLANSADAQERLQAQQAQQEANSLLQAANMQVKTTL